MSKYPHTLASCQETMGSHKFLPFLSIHATLQDTDSPSEISPLRFLCIGFRHHKNVADCINKLTMLTASGICVSPVAYMVLCVRFISFVHVCRSRNRKQRSARNATLDMGGWLDLTKSILRLLPSGTFTLKETTSFACRTAITFCLPSAPLKA